MMAKKAEVGVIYRIVNEDGKDDVDMSRLEALRVYRTLHELLFPSVPSRKPKRR